LISATVSQPRVALLTIDPAAKTTSHLRLDQTAAGCFSITIMLLKLKWASLRIHMLLLARLICAWVCEVHLPVDRILGKSGPYFWTLRRDAPL
ncbi:MAG: hypothetical protein AAFS10_18255, partial [Myxococcota bacterium]